MREATAAPNRTGEWIGAVKRGWRFIRRYPVLPVTVIVVLAIAAIFAPWIAPHDPLKSNLDRINKPPAWMCVRGYGDEPTCGDATNLLGADTQGRDLLSRTIHGARISLLVAGVVLGAGGIIGTSLGVIAGYSGRFWDELIMRWVDFTFAVPFIVLALIAAVVFGASLWLTITLLTITQWPPFARQVRAETLRIKTMDYVASARITGASTRRIAIKHILPGVVNTVMVVASLRVGQLILTEASLSFLGVGIPAPTPVWGGMVAEGRAYIASAWWVSIVPGMAIFLVVFAFNFLGDWMRDFLDPRLRQL